MIQDQRFFLRKYGFLCACLLLTTSCTTHISEKAVTSSSKPPMRLLLLDGDNGTVACRVHDRLTSSTFPKRSDHGSLESATRSLLRMKNLIAVRGVPGASMVGPVDYLGNLEAPDQYVYTIQNGFPPRFSRMPITVEAKSHLKEFDDNNVTLVRAHWISGKEKKALTQKKKDYQISRQELRHSLFLNPGLLEIDRPLIELKYFDPREVDLSSFKARLVNHSLPFRITKTKLPPKDEYRLITYLYESLYADWQVKNGSGHFLEKHRFSQTITPLTPHSSGFVVLARINENLDALELIGVQIPYGYTLIIENDCIHGDSTLRGFFMMGMTSDHTTMRSADTVFLKYPTTRENVKIVVYGLEDKLNSDSDFLEGALPPFVIYKNATALERENFRKLTEEFNFIFNPFSQEYWQK